MPIMLVMLGLEKVRILDKPLNTEFSVHGVTYNNSPYRM